MSHETEQSFLVFAYGTLKRGFCRHHYLRSYDFVAESRTKPKYQMYDCGEYPGMILVSQQGVSIRGEVWSVDAAAIEILDRVEGVAEGLYRRVEIEMAVPFDRPVLGYLYQQDIAGLANCGENWGKGRGRVDPD